MAFLPENNETVPNEAVSRRLRAISEAVRRDTDGDQNWYQEERDVGAAPRANGRHRPVPDRYRPHYRTDALRRRRVGIASGRRDPLSPAVDLVDLRKHPAVFAQPAVHRQPTVALPNLRRADSDPEVSRNLFPRREFCALRLIVHGRVE